MTDMDAGNVPADTDKSEGRPPSRDGKSSVTWRSHVDHDWDHIPTDESQAVTIGLEKALRCLGLDLMPHSGTGPSHPSVLSGHVLAELRALKQRQEDC